MICRHNTLSACNDCREEREEERLTHRAEVARVGRLMNPRPEDRPDRDDIDRARRDVLVHLEAGRDVNPFRHAELSSIRRDLAVRAACAELVDEGVAVPWGYGTIVHRKFATEWERR